MALTKIERMNIADLTPASYNPRKISATAMQGLTSSVRRFGLVQPIVWNKRTRTVVGGHQRMKALADLGITEADVVVVDIPLSEEKALNLSLNNPSITGEFTDELFPLLEELKLDLPDIFTDLRLDDLSIFSRIDAKGSIPSVDDEDERSDGFPIYPAAEIVEDAVRFFKSIPFPYPVMQLHEMKQELNKLASLPLDKCIGSKVGIGIADHFNPHRFHAVSNGLLPPVESFKKESCIRAACQLMIESGNKIPGKYFSAMSIAHGGQACGNFPPAFARMIYETFSNEKANILDPCMGYGGRLVGFLASKAAYYHGVDPNTASFKGNQRMAKEVGKHKQVRLTHKPFEDTFSDLNASKRKFDLVFTSPPYFAKENYSSEKTNSLNRYPEYNSWVNGFLRPLLSISSKFLASQGKVIINIADVQIKGKQYPLEKDTVSCADAAGLAVEKTIKFPLSTRYSKVAGKNYRTQELADEPVFIFKKKR